MRTPIAALLIWIGLASAALAQTPTISNCGTDPSIFGSDFLGYYTTGSGAITCTIKFVVPTSPARTCIIASQFATPPIYTVNSTTINVTKGKASTGYNYMCQG
jgi:hypothetical protein